ncbi:MAG: 8-amino-7-oxononanoate synthase [Myxococcales bacterium]|nr:8-amino-7-oxononanoate synthase [Myxococcales bacterium]
MSARPPPPALRHLREELRSLAGAGLLRERPPVYRGPRPSFCSNDYLGLGEDPGGFEGPGGAGASRLVVGEADGHRALERELVDWLRADAALTFSSGYAANVGALSALAQAGDLIVSDRLNHASIIDGCRLSGARVAVIDHLDVAAMEEVLVARRESRAWVVTESYFSMDGDGPDLAALRALCDRYSAGLIVDEAHALGVLGPEGRGRTAQAGVEADVLIGTLGKALGRQGAFVVGAQALVDWLWNRARSFVFSTGLSPALAHSAARCVRRAREDSSLRERCLENATTLRAALGAPPGFGPIIPLVLGDPAVAIAAAEAARAEGVHVQAIRPPTVPTGTARLRVTASARHSAEDVAAAAAVLKRFT